jgi:hypothetical protein
MGSTPIGHPSKRKPSATAPEAAGLDAVIRGLGAVLCDDAKLVQYALPIYDGLLATFGSSER